MALPTLAFRWAACLCSFQCLCALSPTSASTLLQETLLERSFVTGQLSYTAYSLERLLYLLCELLGTFQAHAKGRLRVA